MEVVSENNEVISEPVGCDEISIKIVQGVITDVIRAWSHTVSESLTSWIFPEMWGTCIIQTPTKSLFMCLL